MNYNNYLDEVYTVGENNYDNQEDSSGNDSDCDQRWRWQDFYETISDPLILRNALDPISDQDQLGNSLVLIPTPAATLFPDRETTPTPGTVPYNAQAQKPDQVASVK